MAARTTVPAPEPDAAPIPPLLIVQGGRDLQVPVTDAQRMAAANPAAKLVILPDLNHVLKDVGEGAPANLAAYRDPALPLGKGVAEAIADFIAE